MNENNNFQLRIEMNFQSLNKSTAKQNSKSWTRSILERNSDFIEQQPEIAEIDQYKDVEFVDVRPSEGRSRLKIRDVSTPITDRSTLKSPNLQQCDEIQNEDDAKRVYSHLVEHHNMVDLLDRIEEDFANDKKLLNQADKTCITLECKMKMFELSFKLVKVNLYKSNPNFDKQVETQIQQLNEKVLQINQQLQQIKGDYFSSIDYICFKDSNSLQIDLLQKTRQKQEPVIRQVEKIYNEVKHLKNVVEQFEKDYHKWEGTLFNNQVSETLEVIKDTQDIMDEIESKLDSSFKDLTQFKKQLRQISIAGYDQASKQLKKLFDEIAAIDQNIYKAQAQQKQHTQTFDRLAILRKNCESIVTSYRNLELLESYNQTVKMEELVQNHTEWMKLFNSLKQIKDTLIDPIEYNTRKISTDFKKYSDSIQLTRKEEYSELIKRIYKVSLSVEEGAKLYQSRLQEVVITHFQGEQSVQIPGSDYIFISKEVVRYENQIKVVQQENSKVLSDTEQIDSQCRQKNSVISTDHIQDLKQHSKILERLVGIELPRVKDNVESLEAYCLKHTKNQLQDSNKKSQNQLVVVKKNFDDLKQIIEQLKAKLAKCRSDASSLILSYQNDNKEKDMERENEYKFQIDRVLVEIDKDVNGPPLSSMSTNDAGTGGESNLQKEVSLFKQRKDLVAAINAVVNQFNESSKINQSMNNSTRNMSSMVTKGNDIMEQVDWIEGQIAAAKAHAADLNQKLDDLNLYFKDFDAKYDHKNDLVDACDDLFDNCEDEIKALDAQIKQQLAVLQDVIGLLLQQSPIVNSSKAASQTENSKFIEQVSDLKGQAEDCRENLEHIQLSMQKLNQILNRYVQPLNELPDREVDTEEIQNVLDQLKLKNLELKELREKHNRLADIPSELQNEVKSLMEGEQSNKIETADEKLTDLNIGLRVFDDPLNDCTKKLAQYNAKIKEAMQNQGKNDAQLMGQLKKLEKDAQGINDQLQSIKAAGKELQQKRDEAKQVVMEAYANPDNYSPLQIYTIIDGINELNQKVRGHRDQINKIDDDLTQRIKDLQNLLGQKDEALAHTKEISDNIAQIKDDMSLIREMMNKLPPIISQLLESLSEMEKGSVPDKSADYWEERKDIERWTKTLNNQSSALQKIKNNFEKKDNRAKELQIQAKKVSDVESLAALRDQVKELTSEVMQLLEETYDCQDNVLGTEKDMNDCEIPVNIKVRNNQIVQLNDKLKILQNEFTELKQADDAFEGTVESEREIKTLILKIDRKVKAFEQEIESHKQYQTSTLDAYTIEQMTSLGNAPIIKNVRLFKQKIEATFKKVDELEEILNQLSELLILQDMGNAVKLVIQQAQNLRKRLQMSQAQLNKIKMTGNEMDGNCSDEGEEEFIDALKDEMPQVFKDLNKTFEQLDRIETMTAQVNKSKSIDDMRELKSQVGDASEKVQQSENLVNRLENEIISWDALKKLCKRDQDLETILTQITDFQHQIGFEKKMLEKTSKTNETELDQAQDNSERQNLMKNAERITLFDQELTLLNEEALLLTKERNTLFDTFDPLLPQSVKEERVRRQVPTGLAKKRPTAKIDTSDKKEDMYYKLSVSCDFKPKIKILWNKLKSMTARFEELTLKYTGLVKSVVKKTAPATFKTYKAVKGDQIDELWSTHINKHQCSVNCVRLGPGKYQFGSKHIICKIVNGALLVRVGGGYMKADEFIEQYGRMELLKAMKEAEDPMFEEYKKQLKSPRGTNTKQDFANIGDYRNIMREQLKNAEVYQETARVSSSIGTQQQRATTNIKPPSPVRQSVAKSPARKSELKAPTVTSPKRQINVYK